MPAAPIKRDNLSPVSTLLLQGGDDRIRLLDGKAFNKYGCRPYPVADCIDFSSSTASHVSASTYDALKSFRHRLSESLSTISPEQVYAHELQQLRTRFLSLWDLSSSQMAVEMIFSASGTDAHLIAASLAQTLHEASLHAIMIQCEESGSGVAAALCGQPFSSCTATGDVPPARAAGATGAAGTTMIHIDLRAPDGSARPAAEVDADFERAANRVLEQGLPAMLVAVDVSKTGLTAPSIDAVARLKNRWGAQLTVLVDACQFRIDNTALHAYLQLGCMVAITGSKFFAAPSFCGALLIPSVLAKAMQSQPMPALLRSYSSGAEWPANWPGANELARVPNMGLLLRWEAALQEMQNFLSVPVEDTHRIMSACAEAIQERLSADPHFRPLDNGIAASNKPATIHAFIPCRPAPDRKMLERSEVERLYRTLQSTVQADGRMYLLGQPVQCAGPGSSPAWALRLCLSAPLIANTYKDTGDETGLNALIEQALACLTAVAATIDQL